MARASGSRAAIHAQRRDYQRLRALPPSERALLVAKIREASMREPLNASTMFVRVVAPPRVGGRSSAAGLHAFYRVQDLRRECMRIWPGHGVLLDCFAEITAREPHSSLARRIELADLMAQKAAARIRTRLTDTTRGHRLDLRVMHRIDVWAENCAVMAKFLSDEEFAYWSWRYDHPKPPKTEAELNARWPAVPVHGELPKGMKGYSRQKAMTRYDGAPEPPNPAELEIQHLTVEPDPADLDWVTEFDEVWSSRAARPETENPAVRSYEDVVKARAGRYVREQGIEREVIDSARRVLARPRLYTNPNRVLAGEVDFDFETADGTKRTATEADRDALDALLAETSGDPAGEEAQ